MTDDPWAGLPPDVAQKIANKVVTEGFRKEGFLSPMSTVLIKHLVPENQGWFDLCDELNRFSQSMWLGAMPDGQRHDPNPVSIRLMAKSNQSFQGAVLLAQRGMTPEADTLSRTCLEIAFWLGFLAKEPDVAAALFVADEYKTGAERARLLAELMEEEHAAPFIKIAADYDLRYKNGPKKLTGIRELAKRGGMSGQYAYYRALSGMSAHPSVSSLDKFVEVDPEGFLQHRVGPDDNGIGFSLMTALNVHLWGVEMFNVIHATEGADESLNAIRAKRDRMLTDMADQLPAEMG